MDEKVLSNLLYLYRDDITTDIPEGIQEALALCEGI